MSNPLIITKCLSLLGALVNMFLLFLLFNIATHFAESGTRQSGSGARVSRRRPTRSILTTSLTTSTNTSSSWLTGKPLTLHHCQKMREPKLCPAGSFTASEPCFLFCFLYQGNEKGRQQPAGQDCHGAATTPPWLQGKSVSQNEKIVMELFQHPERLQGAGT